MRKEITRSITALLLAIALLFVMGADVYATSTVSENEAQQPDPAVTQDEDDQVTTPDADTDDAEDEESEEEEWFKQLNEALDSAEGARAQNNNEEDALSEEMDYTRYLFMGDSTVMGWGAGGTTYPGVFQALRGARVTNAAIGGATYAVRSGDEGNNSVGHFDVLNLGDFDVALVNFGANDFARNVDIGPVNTSNRNTATMVGAMNVTIDRLKAAGIEVYIITPFYFKNQRNARNPRGNTFAGYVSAIRTIARSRSCNLIDFNAQSWITDANYDSLHVDGIHPNAAVYQMAGQYLDRILGRQNMPSGGDGAVGFVKRLYKECLGRTADEAGLNAWVESLFSGSGNGSIVAYGFFFSDEYKMRNISDATFVQTLYVVMMDRTPSQAEIDSWTKCLSEGVSRAKVFKGFADSNEFAGICRLYGINKGSINLTEPRDENPGVTAFVARLYTKALGRGFDVDGLNAWTKALLNREGTPKSVATIGFFHSDEFMNKNTSNEEYVTILYRTFLGREPDADGLNAWVKALNEGASRDQVLAGFSDSPEFAIIMAQYGL